MNITLWVIASLLALAFLAAGSMKLLQPKAKLAASGMGAVENFPAAAIKGIGALEVLGALGLILPALFSTAPGLVPVAATGLALLMIGAAITHARRREYTGIVANAALGGLALALAIFRFGPYSF